jgi:hypothetical protein
MFLERIQGINGHSTRKLRKLPLARTRILGSGFCGILPSLASHHRSHPGGKGTGIPGELLGGETCCLSQAIRAATTDVKRRAVSTLGKVIVDPNTPPGVKVGAEDSILNDIYGPIPVCKRISVGRFCAYIRPRSEGNRPRALMESAFLPLNTGPVQKQVWKKLVCPLRHHRVYSCNLKESFSSGGSVRFVMSQRDSD